MSPIKRSRRLQAGLAGLSVISALGAALGLGLTTHTQGSQSGQSSADGNGGSGPAQATSHRGGEGDDEGGSRQSSGTTQQTSPVTPPSNSTPQATTSGS